MPIAGLTDRGPSFKEIGRLRLGIPKAQAAKEGSGPREISYFRLDMRPDEEESIAAFVNEYGTQPTRINIRLPFPEISRVWDANYEVYNTSGLLGMANGETWQYLRSNKTGEIMVKNGEPFMAFDKNVPVYSYKNKKGEDVPVFAKITGRLKVVVPELRRAAYMVMITHSVYNVIYITEQLAAIDVLAKTAGLSLPFVPMVLARRKEKISVTFNGKKSYQDHYLVNIEINPLWMGASFAMLENSLPGMKALPEKVDPEDVVEDETFEAGEEYIEPEQQPDVVITPMPDEETVTAAPEYVAGARPYPPAVVKEKIADLIKQFFAAKTTDADGKIVASCLDTTLGGSTPRYIMCKWLVGKESTKDMTHAQTLALKTWLGVDTFGAPPAEHVMQEAAACFQEALKASGQMVLDV